MAAIQRAPEDRLQHALASFACGATGELDASVSRGAKVAILDTLAVALGALSHPAAQAARRYARLSSCQDGARIWGTGERVSPETAALVNGVPLRGYDYNDLYSNLAGGHPSDMIPGLVALAEWRQLPGSKLLEAVAVGYEVVLNLFDTLNNHVGGWDYPTTLAIGSCCSSARLLGLSAAQTREALAITVAPHFASLEAESSELNARGDLTMWKRFNGSDATRHAVYACLLAQCGVEGVVRPFEGKHGFLVKYGAGADKAAQLHERLDPKRPLSRINDVVFKRWPVGSRGQSAIQAALEARATITDPWQARQVKIFSDEAAYDHLVRLREAPWHPDSRETADHSLPYIVTAAILDGWVKAESFEPSRVLEARRQQFLQERVTAEPAPELAGGAKKGFLSRVEIVDGQGRLHQGAAKAPPGHPSQPFTDADFEQKLVENAAPLFGAPHVAQIASAVWSLDKLANVRKLCDLLMLQDASLIDPTPTS
jgi:2-methylcitrate dehydratase